MTHLLYSNLQKNSTLQFLNEAIRKFSSIRIFSKLKCNFVKKTHLQYYSTMNTKYLGADLKELTIPLSYGNIAAQAWGKSTGYPVLALHGLLDNCGTFDRLFPLISDKLYIVAIDAPGHGMSCHKPPGSFYTDISMIMDFKKVTDFLGFQKFGIIAHSLGGAFALMFASIFPENVQKLAVLDLLKPFSRDIDLFPNETRIAVKNYLEIEQKIAKAKPPPVYTEELAAKRLCEGLFNEVSLDGAKILNKRGTKLSPCGNGVLFTRDARCMVIEQFSRRSNEFVQQFMTAVQSELLIILAKNSYPIYKTYTEDDINLYSGIYRKNAKKFILHHVDGNHFMHLSNPEKIAPLINNFFSDI